MYVVCHSTNQSTARINQLLDCNRSTIIAYDEAMKTALKYESKSTPPSFCRNFDLGIFIDADLTMRTQVIQTCSKCFVKLSPFDSYEAYVVQSQTTCYSRLSWRWCFPGLTTALQLARSLRTYATLKFIRSSSSSSSSTSSNIGRLLKSFHCHVFQELRKQSVRSLNINARKLAKVIHQ